MGTLIPEGKGLEQKLGEISRSTARHSRVQVKFTGVQER